MRYLSDGATSTDPLYRFGVPTSDLINQAMIDQNLIGDRLELSTLMLNEFDREARHLLDLLHENRLNKCKKTLELRYRSQDNFFAQVGGHDGEYGIEISIAVPLIALSVAIELFSLMENSEIAHLAPSHSGTDNSIKYLFPKITSTSDVSARALDLALDVSLLLFLHETAHMVFGHCDYQCNNDNEERALEFDADFNAGTMFACWIQGLPHPRRRTFDFQEASSRLVKSAFLLGLILKAVSGPTNRYHLPTVRVISFIAGGAFGFESMGATPKIEQEDEANKFWEDLINRNQEELIAATSKSSLAKNLGTEDQIERDIKDLYGVTHKTRDQLKDGPLRKTQVNA
ncbi:MULTISPECIES: hypothetical protein [unclassified Pseudomonas]|uniref:hypothetical protein n=1 Tax=unclassified Pseudomonas TaxID=196821 RepID=UPI002892DED2|nr:MULTISPECIES: hypothetical protein [unclassified Pseudomonas]